MRQEFHRLMDNPPPIETKQQALKLLRPLTALYLNIDVWEEAVAALEKDWDETEQWLQSLGKAPTPEQVLERTKLKLWTPETVKP
jgi:hypothetical protein